MWSLEQLDEHEPLKRKSFELLDAEDGPIDNTNRTIEYQIDDVMRQGQRNRFYARVRASQRFCTEARQDLKSARSSTDVDMVLIRIAAFDEGLPRWMGDHYQCHVIGLTPMRLARTFLKRDIYNASKRVAV